MAFVYPYFLAALGLLAIPVIIHLFNFRRYKTVYFTNVRFLKNVNDETTNRSKLKHLLVLISRLLAFTFLVLAFAQPYIPVSDAGAKKGEAKIVSIYLDNSFSMNAASEAEPLFQLGKKKVQDIIDAYSEDTKFQLVTNDFEPRQQRLAAKDDIKNRLDEIELTPVVKTLSEVAAFQKNLLQQYEGQKLIYWISDFQKNIADAVFDSTYQYYCIPLQAVKQQNLFIDSCWLEKPVLFVNEPNRLFFKIGNAGNEDVQNVRVTMSINDQIKAIADAAVPAKSFSVDTMSFSIQEYGWLKMKVFINDFPVTFDDQYFLTFKTNELIKILAVNEQQENNFLKALFFEQPNYALDNVNSTAVDANKLNDYNLIILNNLNIINASLAAALENYMKSGGTVLVFAGAEADINSYNKFFSITGANEISEKSEGQNEVSYLNENSELFNDVFDKIPQNLSLPKVKLYYTFIKKTRSSEQVILGMKNNASFLSQYNFSGGKLLVCASPLNKDYSDFPVHSIFVPLVYKMAVSASAKLKTSYILGKDNQIEIADENVSAEAIYKIRNAETEWIPGQRNLSNRVFLNLDNQFKQAGFFEAVNEKKQRSEWVALNFNRQESQLETFSKEELEEKYDFDNVKILDALTTNFTEVVQQIDRGIALWKLCIILALISLAAEVLLLRFLA